MKDISRLAGSIGLRPAQIFREIIRAGSTRRAARALDVTQSAVSQHLKQFEDAVGEKLFVRDGRGLIPTTNAIEIYNRIDRYFETLQHIENEILDSFSATRNTLTISAPHITCLSFIPKLALELDRADRTLELHVKAQRYDQIAHSLLTGEADLGISRLPLDERFFHWLVIAEIKSVCIMSAGHPLSRKDFITEEDLVCQKLLSIEREYAANPLGSSVSNRRRNASSANIYVDSVGLGAMYIANGLCVSVDNEFTAKQYATLGLDLAFVPFRPGAAYRYVVFSRHGNEKALKYLNIVRDSFRREYF
ncbi:LysR family transcriptional regulator [Chelatococcus sp. YT9]|uniref:LysR family transcriptional regulator n=1 Tax=Chelatococcus sp. YT9 TaxID=2835635 RepID=UPI001BD0A265|nr:LysR family transcriptional regulator [Chelatococcus sp. YT9]MBS7700190.1 LysR family transcriptional regulator [Chelatococcus sp. YT9]